MAGARSGMTVRGTALASAAYFLLVPGVARAQDHAPIRPEVRLDATAATIQRLEAGAGAAFPLGTYVRFALVAAGGVGRDTRADAAHDGRIATARADAIARFEIDPFHQSKRGFYGGGGVSYLAAERDRGRVYLTLVAGVELRDVSHMTPAIELALGGGVRLGVALRRSGGRWR
jgi:hypothetical protein